MLKHALPLCCAVLIAGPAGAQTPGRGPLGVGEAQITVTFSVPFSSEERDPIKLVAAQSQFRKTLYEAASRECVSLVQTIADECRMASMNINVANQGGGVMMVTIMNATAQFRVTLKGQ